MAPPDPSVTRIDGPWRHLDIHANGIRFHVVEAAPTGHDAGTPPTARPLVIMLHGFGSFWWSWRHQLRGLAGVRAVAVDLRGSGGRQTTPWLRRLDASRRHRRADPRARAFVGDSGRPRRRRAGLLGHVGG